LDTLVIHRQTAIGFLNAPPVSVHHSLLLPSSIFITSSLEWRLGGFDVLSTKDDGQGVLWTSIGGFGGMHGGDLVQGGIAERSAPEVRRGGWIVLKE
jgi:SCY1-like protein 1